VADRVSGPGSEANNRLYVDGLRRGLSDLGWVDGRTIVIEIRFAEGKTDQLPRLAAELVHSKVDVIVTSTTPAALAAKHATTTVPIVIGFVADPVGSGIVASLSHARGAHPRRMKMDVAHGSRLVATGRGECDDRTT